MSVGNQAGDTLNLHREVSIAIPSAHSDKCMAVRCTEWRRLRSRVSAVTAGAPWVQLLYPLLFGISGSACLSLASLGCVEEAPTWVWVMEASIFFGTLLGGIAFAFADKTLAKERRQSIAEIAEDMDAIEQAFVTDAGQVEKMNPPLRPLGVLHDASTSRRRFRRLTNDDPDGRT